MRACLDLARPVDLLFLRAWETSLAAVDVAQRSGALPGITGHIAESVCELLLADLGYAPVWHHAGPGRHGVGLMVLHLEAGMLFAIEVKGTLRSGRIPRLTRGEREQMSEAWLDKSDNPAMLSADIASADLYTGVLALNFAEIYGTIDEAKDDGSTRRRVLGEAAHLGARLAHLRVSTAPRRATPCPMTVPASRSRMQSSVEVGIITG